MKNYRIVILAAFSGLFFTGCLKKLDLTPTNNLSPAQLYSTPQGYQQAMAKVYSAWALTGNEGPAGNADLPTQIIKDEGNSDFFRDFWYLQCLSTDEAGWNFDGNTDPIGIHEMAWDQNTEVVGGVYYRAFFQITLANDFINQSSDANLASRGISGLNADTIRQYRAEARFLRAYQYWVLMDLFGNPPFVNENTVIGSTIPPQIKRADLFNYVVSELKAINAGLVAPKQNLYGRADQATAWALLARVYLNAQVYTGTPQYDSAITYCNKVINAGYTLHPNYAELMLADNNLNTDEFIFTIPYDATHTQTYGGTTFLVNGPAEIPTAISGGTLAGSWNCIRFTQQFVGLFDTVNDKRGQFWSQGQTLDLTQLIGAPTDGYSSYKFRNLTRSGAEDPDADPSHTFSSIDLPVFRLAEIYLIYAEAVLRGATTGSPAQALTYYNDLETRGCNGSTVDNQESITLQDVLNERGKELFWEGFRRTDLVRYGQFTTGAYIWAWKGGVQGGTPVSSNLNLYPIPQFDISANHNLIQNPGY
jgi:starch-binding outer membrane protein, SusD/RagB family